MGYLIRHVLAIAMLPFVVAVIVPLWIARRNATTFTLGDTRLELLAQFGGLTFSIVGVALFLSSLHRFARDGKGTLAPWDPPRRLVVNGPYRHVRNPMISGVVFMLFAEALLLLSRAHGGWALTFLAINAIYIPLLEEPGLRRRFGAGYDEYCRHVPRLLPRLRPWRPPAP